MLQLSLGLYRVISLGAPFGVLVEINGLGKGRIYNSPVHSLHILPGESFTLFRTFSKPENDQDVAYATPGPGQYRTRVVVLKNTMLECFLFSVDLNT
jgi:hypothetical protein